MEEVYERRRGVDVVGPLGEDGPAEIGEVRDRGLFDRRSDYYNEADAYASELGGRPGVVYEGDQRGVERYGGSGYYGPGPAMVYEDGGYYGPRRRPDVVYVDAPVGEASDLGMGLMDSNIRTRPDYGDSLTRPDFAGVPVIGAYEVDGRGLHHGRHEHGYGADAEFEEERRRKRYAEAAAAAAVGYGLHERRERIEDEERLEDLGYDVGDGRRRHEHHGLFRRSDS